jgi:hypothetical protein
LPDAQVGSNDKRAVVSCIALLGGGWAFRKEALEVGAELGTEGIGVLCPPLLDARGREESSETPLLCQKQVSFSGTHMGLIVDRLKDMKVGEKHIVELKPLLLAQRTSVRGADDPNTSEFGTLSDGNVDVVHGIANRVERTSACGLSVASDLQS